MQINQIEVKNIFSYDDNTIIPFSKNISLIVGPNNSGKTNIIRLLDLFLKELAYPNQNFLDSFSFKNEDSALKIKILFADTEMDAIIGLFYLQSVCFFNNHPLKDKEKLRHYFNEADIEIKWKKNYIGTHSPHKSEIKINFTKLNTIFYLDENRLINTISNNKSRYVTSNFLKTLSSLDKPDFSEYFSENEKEDLFKEYVSSFDLDRLSKRCNIESKYNDNREFYQTFEDLKTFFQNNNSNSYYTLPLLLHNILKSGLFYTKRRNILSPVQVFSSEYLENDGSNLVNFLHTLKMSIDYSKRDCYYKIQSTFKTIFLNRISFEIIAIEKKENNNLISLIFYDNSGKSIDIFSIGDGIIDVLLLLSISIGQQDKIIILDEPANNLHNTLLEVLIKEIIKNKKNQLILITHSEVLLKFIFYKTEPLIIYCRLVNNNTTIDYFDTSDQDIKNLRLEHIFEPKALLGNVNVVVEGQSDYNIINGLSYYYTDSTNEQYNKLSLEKNDYIIQHCGGKLNFPKYQKIFTKVKIPFYFIADSDVLEDKTLKNVFNDFTYLEPNMNFKPNKNKFVIKNGNLEDLLKQIDSNAYTKALEDASSGRGNNKPLIAKKWLEYAYTNQTNLSLFENLFKKLLNLV